MIFEFDPEKSAANLAKHGIDFEAAQALWLDECAFEIDARSTTEPRSALIGTIEGKHWIAFFTPRDGAIRIISVRRARDYEVITRLRLMNAKKIASAEELDRMFDAGEDMADYFDWSSARKPGQETKRVNVDFPQWMIARLDREAKRRGVTRQALIKMWLADRLDQAA